jgi:hypothetical protein
MHVQTNPATNPSRQSHHSPPARLSVRGEPAGQRHRPIRAQPLNPGKSQGRPNEKPGLEAHRSKRPTPLRSPNARPLSQINRTYEPTRTEPHEQFHASRWSADARLLLPRRATLSSTRCGRLATRRLQCRGDSAASRSRGRRCLSIEPPRPVVAGWCRDGEATWREGARAVHRQPAQRRCHAGGRSGA